MQKIFWGSWAVRVLNKPGKEILKKLNNQKMFFCTASRMLSPPCWLCTGTHKIPFILLKKHFEEVTNHGVNLSKPCIRFLILKQSVTHDL